MTFVNKLSFAFYYIVIKNLPNSRYINLFGLIRTLYVCKCLGVMEYSKDGIVEDNVYLSNGINIRIGKRCHINENVFIQGAIVGDDVLIAPGVCILNSTHNYLDSEKTIIKQGELRGINPTIGNDVWIGRNSIIMPGIKIGEGAVVGSGSVVTKDVGSYDVVAGVPAIKIKSRKKCV